MRRHVFTPGKLPRIVVEIHCDTDLMIAMIKDKELEAAEVSTMLTAGVEQIMAALRTGLQKRQQQEMENGPSNSRSNDNDGGVRGSKSAT